MSITDLRETKVEHFHIAVARQLNISGLEIAVNDSLFMSGLERFGNSLCDFQRFF
jgi:hypothetical protein